MIENQQKENQVNILVYYIGIGHINPDEVEEYLRDVASKIHSSTFLGEMIFIAVEGNNSRVECINPLYVTDKRLISKHTTLMKELKDNLLMIIDDKTKTKKVYRYGDIDGLTLEEYKEKIRLEIEKDILDGKYRDKTIKTD